MPTILLVKTSSLGDVIQNLPVVTDLKRQIPGAEVDWLVEEAFADLPRLHPGVRAVVPVALRRWRKRLVSRGTWKEIGELRRRLASIEYDFILDSQGLLKSALLTRLARGTRCGYASPREALAARFYDRRFAVDPGLSAVERYRGLAGAALGYETSGHTDYGISAPALAAAWVPSQPYAVLLHVASRDDKLWPEPRWVELGQALGELGVSAVLPWGSGAEQERSQRLARQLPAGIVPPRLSLREAASLLSGARIAIGLDTGLTYLALALGRPTIRIYCGVDQGRTRFYQPPHTRNLGAEGSPPAAVEVIAAARDLLHA